MNGYNSQLNLLSGEDISEKRNDIGNSKELPIFYSKNENCCGCSACYAICPVNAISMKPDVEGFLYPSVDSALCIRCYKCLSVCVFKRKQLEKGLF